MYISNEHHQISTCTSLACRQCKIKMIYFWQTVQGIQKFIDHVLSNTHCHLLGFNMWQNDATHILQTTYTLLYIWHKWRCNSTLQNHIHMATVYIHILPRQIPYVNRLAKYCFFQSAEVLDKETYNSFRSGRILFQFHVCFGSILACCTC